jgi:thiol-disulfide isomerase/thioredoxin
MSHLTRWALLLLLGVCLAGCRDRATTQEPQQSDEPQHVLVGQKAPLFSASLLDEGRFDLAEVLGSKVVILDFWATWCGPCREALPTLSEVATEFADRGVAFYAVDLDETPAQVKAFLEQAGLELNVVLDEDNRVAMLYKAEAIPQTVIIDRQGTVRYVHVGTSPDLRQRLTRELTELTSESASSPDASQPDSAKNAPAGGPAAS